jgi:hypothetical protein
MTAMRFTALNRHSRDLVERSVSWMDEHWDEQVDLLSIRSEERFSDLPTVHHIRETSWYALGLLQRGSSSDVERACRALQAILRYQFDEPGAVYDGTWYRYMEEPHPGNAAIWKGYDPNWREFIGTTLAIILLEYERDLPAMLVAGIDEALHKAIRGALTRDLPATYTNIALMNAFLMIFAGERFGEKAWISNGEKMAREIYRLFTINNVFSEFNSPTYYGVDLYALGLWCTYSSSAWLRQAGAKMEAALWKDIALMYQADMKNMAGPFDRSYGMDLRRYASTIGMWIWMAIGKEHAPFPAIEPVFKHDQDLCFAPHFVAVGARVPQEVLPVLRAFQGERQVERVIANKPRRVATAWIGKRLLIGGEYTGYSEPASDQIHPATIHWKIEEHSIGWIRLVYAIPINAYAEKGQLTISCDGQGKDIPDFVFQIYAPGALVEMILPDQWLLPALTVHVETNAHHAETSMSKDCLWIRYAANEVPSETLIFFTLKTIMCDPVL